MGAITQKWGVPLTVSHIFFLLISRSKQRRVCRGVVALLMTRHVCAYSLSGTEGLLNLGHKHNVDGVDDVHDHQVDALHAVESLIGDEDDEAHQAEEVEEKIANEDVTAHLDGLGRDYGADRGNNKRAEESSTTQSGEDVACTQQ